MKRPKTTPELYDMLDDVEKAIASPKCPEGLRKTLEEFAEEIRLEIEERVEGIIRLA